MSNIFNISTSNSFVDTLATKLLDDYKNDLLSLSNVVILLPNHRSCTSLSEAFVRIKGMQPTLLPQIKAIGDIEEDELILTGDTALQEFTKIPPAITPIERNIIFMKLIISRHNEFGLEKISLAQACFLAQELGNLIDKAHLQELDWSNITNLVPDEYATHWQETLKFLDIITSFWPKILDERGLIDSAKRKSLLIKAQCHIWQSQKTKQRIIVAGTTAVSPSMKLLVKTVLDLPNGEVYLSGLDKDLEDDAWEDIDETHPQFELKQLLDYLQIPRNKIDNLVEPKNKHKEKFISEVMRPAAHTHKWLNITPLPIEAVKNIKLIECKNSRAESISIATILRETLEIPSQTAALITPDRNLARRVANELIRWQIDIDDSAGTPLSLTPWGIYMRAIVKAFSLNSGKNEILALLRNQLFLFNKDDNIINHLDKTFWRLKQKHIEAEKLLQDIKDISSEFTNIIATPRACLSDILKAHILIAEKLSSKSASPNDSILWQNEDGEAGAAFLAELLAKIDILGEIETSQYLDFFESLMRSVVVHNKKNYHPRIRILSPREARLNHFDRIILGGFNEGVWPTIPSADPWMSRPMKKDFGLEQPEKQIGVLALDFTTFLGAPNIYITRAQNDSGTPTIKSRWQMRLETVLQALKIDIKEVKETLYTNIAEKIDLPQKFIKIEAPAPKPPVDARPRKLSASAFEKLLRDPYGVFAEYILKLKPLDELDKNVDVSDFGNIVHKILEDFTNRYPNFYPENAKEILLDMGKKAFEENNLSLEKLSFWWPKFNQMIQWISENEHEYRKQIKTSHNEVWGQMFFDNAPAGRFEIYAKADRIDETTDGKINIIDYKTGRARKISEIKKGYAPQLPIEGLIASEGGFDNIKKAKINSLMYWKLGDSIISVDDGVDEILNDTKQHISEIINLFDFETTGYLSRPNPKNVPEYSDYEHLSRVREWSIKEDGEE